MVNYGYKSQKTPICTAWRWPDKKAGRRGGEWDISTNKQAFLSRDTVDNYAK